MYAQAKRRNWVGWISVIGYAALCGLMYLLRGTP